MEFIASGTEADIYRKGNKVIKLFKEIFPKNIVEYEANLQIMASEYGLPVPEIFDIIEINGRNAIIMEFLDGISLGEKIKNEENGKDKYIKKSIEIQININDIRTTKFPLMKNKLKDQISNTEKLNNLEKNKILEKLDMATFEDNLCHCDLHLGNLIETSNGIKIIDWLSASSGSPYAEVCRTYLLYKMHGIELSELYLETYCKLMKIDKAKILIWTPIVAGARLSEGINNEIKELLEIIRSNL